MQEQIMQGLKAGAKDRNHESREVLKVKPNFEKN